MQCELIDLIARDELFFVGDEFQSIYRFRHADVEVFKERREQIGEVLPLTQNWRSRPEVLAVVNELFGATFGDEFQKLVAAGRFPDPASGAAVELLVTDKASYKDTGVTWRRGEARAVARRVRELVDDGEAEPGEIVLLFAAGTDAEQYEEALRELDLPTYRATGRGYFGQQQVVDLLGYLRLLHNRYDDEAFVTVLASPFVGLSNDALVVLRRNATRRPLYTAVEKGLPEGLSERDRRLLQAFRQRYGRLTALAGTVGLERLCEQIVVEHDYDLAVLARWDGRRRYANLRKLARLARSYEELRGTDVEGFVRFVSEQDAAGVKELEAVAEEEGAGAVRLLTIHAAKGLEFKVVVVADAGRERMSTRGEEIICLPDGRFGFKVVDPLTGQRVGAFEYDEVRNAEEAAAEAERLRLYYVAMTRAIDKLIVAGSIEVARPDPKTPIGWVLDRLELGEVEDGEVVRGEARLRVRVDRFTDDPVPEPEEPPVEAQLSLFEAPVSAPASTVPALPPLEPVAAPAVEPVRRLSYSALALFERCPYRFYAERLGGMRPVDGSGRLVGQVGMAASEIGDSVHRLLERVDLAAPAPPSLDEVLGWYPGATAEELERIGALVQAYCGSALAARLAALGGVSSERPFAFEHDGVLFHGVLDVLHLENGRALVADFKSNFLGDHSPAEVVDAEYRLQRLVYAIACFRAGVEEVEVVYQFLERPDELVAATFRRDELPGLEAELSAVIAQIQSGMFPPRPSEFACAGCPALDVVCAGPALNGDSIAAMHARVTGQDVDVISARREAGRRAAFVDTVPDPRHGEGEHPRERAPGDRAMPRTFIGEARKRVGPKRERILPIIERLKAEHADAGIALRFRTDVELLVSVMLSAQTTDVNVNRVTERLFEKYRRPEDYLAVPKEELEQDIYATGFFRQKAKAIRGTMAMLIEEYDGRVPRRIEELVRLPGVARKTANVVAAELGEPQGVVVDTHVRRLSQRLGLTRHDDPVKIERDLQRLVPREHWGIFPHLLIWHGRRVCIARAPRCLDCVLLDLCPSSRV